MDAAFVGDKGVPGVAAGIDDSLIVRELAMRERALPQIEPDPLHWVEFR